MQKREKDRRLFMARWSSVYLAGAGTFFSSLPSTLKPLFSSNNPKHSDATCSMRAKRRLESLLQSWLDYIRIQCILRGTFEGNVQPKELVATACVCALSVCLSPFHSKSACHHAGGSRVRSSKRQERTTWRTYTLNKLYTYFSFSILIGQQKHGQIKTDTYYRLHGCLYCTVDLANHCYCELCLQFFYFCILEEVSSVKAQNLRFFHNVWVFVIVGFEIFCFLGNMVSPLQRWRKTQSTFYCTWKAING